MSNSETKVNPVLFQIRYRLCQMLLADRLFTEVVNKPTFADLSSFALIQSDGGFYITALRIIDELTAIPNTNESAITQLQERVLAGQTLYLNRGPLTEAASANFEQEIREASGRDALVKLNLFDRLVHKAIYDVGFSAYVEPTYTTLDTVDPNAAFCPANEFHIFDMDTLQKISGLLDLEDNTQVKATVKYFKQHPVAKNYSEFLKLADTFAVAKV